MHSPITQLEELNVNNRSRIYLREISKWTFFLSIVGFIGIAFMIILGIFSNVIYGDAFNAIYKNQLPFNMSLIMTILYLVFAVIYLAPVLYLYNFSRRLKRSLSAKNNDTLADALKMLKSHYKFIGVFMIIMLSLYALLFIVGMLGIALA
jgi:uncharacterized membrane protein